MCVCVCMCGCGWVGGVIVGNADRHRKLLVSFQF